MDDRIEEILRRLEALERRVDALAEKGGVTQDHACAFVADERRIVDLIVRLVGDRIEQGAHDRGREECGHGPPPPPHHHCDHHGHDHGHHQGPPRDRRR